MKQLGYSLVLGVWSLVLESAVSRTRDQATGHGDSLKLRHLTGWIITWFTLISALGPCTACAEDVASTFEQANKLFEQGKYREAAGAYEKLIQRGNVSETLYFNLGNALFKSGQTGRAIASYQLAERLAPRDPDVRANLQFARNSVNGGVTPPNRRWDHWVNRLTLNEWSALFCVGCWVWFALLVLGQCQADLKRSLRGYTATAGLGFALLALGLGLACYDRFHTIPAIVIAQEVLVRYGPLDESQGFYSLRDGAELTVLDRKDNWLQVMDASRRIGWLRRESVLVIPPEKG